MNMKRFLASTMILGLSMGSLSNLAFASEEIVKTNENIDIGFEHPLAKPEIKSLSQEILANKDFSINDLIININDSTLESKFKPYVENNTIMLPLNDVATSLGFNITWNEKLNQIDINKGPIFTSIKNNENRYFFGRMAPVKLNEAPKIIDGTTYVPVEFFSNILRIDNNYDSKNLSLNLRLKDKEAGNSTDIIKEKISIDGNASDSRTVESFSNNEIKRTVNEDENNVTVEGFITQIIKKDNGIISIQIGDMSNGVILNISENTKILDINNEQINIDDLKEGCKIKATHSMMMTSSLPPQTNALSINLLEVSKDEITRISDEETSKDSITIEGYIKNINITDRGTKMVQVGSFQKGVILLIDDETKITDESGNEVDFDELTEDTKIQAVHSMVMTMSIPGQTRAFEIKVLN
ncbi:stalk domain-containing protein [Peptostreptococcaceae bacterium AGR-M142]